MNLEKLEILVNEAETEEEVYAISDKAKDLLAVKDFIKLSRTVAERIVGLSTGN